MEDSAYWDLKDDGSFWVYVKPAAYYNHLEWRFKRNPMFLKRCLEYTRKAEEKNEKEGNTGPSIRVEFSSFVPPTKAVSHGMEKVSMFVAVCENLSKKEFRPLMVKLVQLPTQKKLSLLQNEPIPSVVFPNIQHPLERLVVLFVIRVSHPDMSGLRLKDDDCLTPVLTRKTCFGMLPVGSKVWWAVAPTNLKVTRASQLQLHVGKVTIAELSMWDGVCSKRCELLLMTSAEDEGQGVPKLMVEVRAQSGNGAAGMDGGYFSTVDNKSDKELAPSGESAGRVTFRYVYGAQQKKSVQEITHNFGCPLCHMECGNFAGLKHHLTSSHDLLNFQEEQDAHPTLWVNCRRDIYDHNGDVWCPETQALASSSQAKVFFLNRRIKRKRQSLRDAHKVADTSQAVSRMEQEQAGNSGGPSVVGARKAPTGPRRRSTVQVKGGFTKSNTQAKKKQGSNPRTTRRTTVPSHDGIPPSTFYHSSTAVRMTPLEAAGHSDTDDDEDNERKWELQTLRDMDGRKNASKAEREFMFLWSQFMRSFTPGFADYKMREACYRFTLENREFLKAPHCRIPFALHLSTLFNFRLVTPEVISNCLKAVEVEHFSEQLRKEMSLGNRSTHTNASVAKAKKLADRSHTHVNTNSVSHTPATGNQMDTDDAAAVPVEMMEVDMEF